MTREKKIRTIQTRIIDEKKHDLKKFSNKTSNKNDWNAMNHLTCFIYDVRHQNFVKFNDFFFDFVFDDAEKNRRIWSLMQYILKNIVDSKSNRDTNQKNKSEIADDVMKFASVSNSQVKIFKFNKNRRNQTLKRHDETIEFENDFIVDLKQFFNLTEEKIINFSENENSNSNDFDSNNFDFINVEKMIREFYFAIFNIKNKWWKVWLINKIIAHKNDHVVFMKKIKFVNDSIKMIEIDAENWLAKNSRKIDEDILQYDDFDDNAKIKFNDWKFYFDNIAYQKNNFEKFCINIDIDWKNNIENIIFRIENMSCKQQLHYWQSSIINWLRNMKKIDKLNDCIYANYMTLEKTWIIVIFCIIVNSICARFFICLLQKSFRFSICYFLDFVKVFHNCSVYDWRENLSQ